MSQIPRDRWVVRFRIVQTVWATALLGIVTPLYLAANNRTAVSVAYAALFALYGVATLGMLLDRKWGWLLSLAWLLGYWLLHGWIGAWNFAVNLYMFGSGHDLYADSPATIFIVFINALIGLVPGTLLALSAFFGRRTIAAIIRGVSPQKDQQ